MRIVALLFALSACGTERAQALDSPCLHGLPPGAPRPCGPIGRVCELDWAYARNAEPLCNGSITCGADGTWHDLSNGLACGECPMSPDAGRCGVAGNEGLCSFPSAGLVCGCYFCGAGGWSCNEMGAPCNPRPELGSPCSDSTLVCTYGTYVEKCTGGVWVQSFVSCP